MSRIQGAKISAFGGLAVCQERIAQQSPGRPTVVLVQPVHGARLQGYGYSGGSVAHVEVEPVFGLNPHRDGYGAGPIDLSASGRIIVRPTWP